VDVFDEVFAASRRYSERFHDPDLPTGPRRRLAVLCCMDSRIDVFALLGLNKGDAHIVRNAGGLVTDDSVRSLALSRWKLGVESILVIQHTRCGLQHLDERALLERIRSETGAVATIDFGSFADVDASVGRAIDSLRSNAVFRGMDVRGAVYDVDTGRLREVPVGA
jgi:carbonic anhydrase